MAAIFALIFLSSLFTSAAPQELPLNPSPSPESESDPGCVDELVGISPCLGYVAADPNNVTNTVTVQCCDAFVKAFNSHDGNCFCYMVNQPRIFGFPLNEARVLFLPSVCAFNNSTEIGGSVRLICSESPLLPPLHSSTGEQNLKPPALDPHNNSSPPASRPISEPVMRSPTAAQQKPGSYSPKVKNLRHELVQAALVSLAIYLAR